MLGSFCLSIALAEGTPWSRLLKILDIDTDRSGPHDAHLVTLEGMALFWYRAGRLLFELLGSDRRPSRNIFGGC